MVIQNYVSNKVIYLDDHLNITSSDSDASPSTMKDFSVSVSVTLESRFISLVENEFIILQFESEKIKGFGLYRSQFGSIDGR